MTDHILPEPHRYSIQPIIPLAELIGSLTAPVHSPIGKPPRPIDSADARTRALIEVMRRPAGCARSTVDALVLRKVNLGRLLRPFALDVYCTISAAAGARYIAVPAGMRPGTAFAMVGDGCWQI